MKLTDKKIEKYQLIREAYMYDSLEEREEHLYKMQLDGWEVDKTDNRKKYGYMAILSKEETIK